MKCQQKLDSCCNQRTTATRQPECKADECSKQDAQRERHDVQGNRMSFSSYSTGIRTIAAGVR